MRTGQWPEGVNVRSASGKFDSRGGRFDAARAPSPALRATTTPTAGDLESETDRESITRPVPIIGPGCPLVHSSASGMLQRPRMLSVCCKLVLHVNSPRPAA